MTDTPDERTPWTIKGFPAEVRRRAVDAAGRRDEHMWIWIARAVERQLDIEANDAVLPANQTAEPPLTVTERAVLINAMANLASANAALLQAGGRTVGRRMLTQQAEALMQGEAPKPVIPARKLRVVE
jgi:hypothetical protein